MSEEQEKTLLILEKNTLEKQMELRYNELERRGIAEPELTRAVQAEFYDYPTPKAEPWPGPVTGTDLAGNINLDIIPDSGFPPVIQPNTDKTEPFPTPNQSPYGIGTTGTPYPSFATPSPSSNPNATDRPIGAVSDVLSITNFPAEQSNNWSGTASDLNSEPSMEGEHGFNVEKSIPEWRYPIEDSQIDFTGIEIPPITIEPSGQFNEAVMPDKGKKKTLMDKLNPFIKLLGAGFSASSLIDSYMSKAPEEPEARNEYFTHNVMEVMAEFVLSPTHTGTDVCDDYSGKTFDLMDAHDRPVLPSEGKGYVNLVHPHLFSNPCYG